MTNPNTIEDLEQRIEQLVQEYIAASRKAAQEAVEGAFASAARVPIGTARPVAKSPGKKRASAEIAVLGERFYEAVSAKTGETMTVLAAEVGVSARELHRSGPCSGEPVEYARSALVTSRAISRSRTGQQRLCDRLPLRRARHPRTGTAAGPCCTAPRSTG